MQTGARIVWVGFLPAANFPLLNAQRFPAQPRPHRCSLTLHSWRMRGVDAPRALFAANPEVHFPDGITLSPLARGSTVFRGLGRTGRVSLVASFRYVFHAPSTGDYGWLLRRQQRMACVLAGKGDKTQGEARGGNGNGHSPFFSPFSTGRTSLSRSQAREEDGEERQDTAEAPIIFGKYLPVSRDNWDVLFQRATSNDAGTRRHRRLRRRRVYTAGPA